LFALLSIPSKTFSLPPMKGGRHLAPIGLLARLGG
jgi:hypothetical protein